jgi:hypothetical protein
MELSRSRTSVSQNSAVIFPRLESWNAMTKVATIAADVNKKRVLCRVSMEILVDKFGEMEEGPLRMLAANRIFLQDAARRLIERNAYEEDGSIIIRAGDIVKQETYTVSS